MTGDAASIEGKKTDTVDEQFVLCLSGGGLRAAFYHLGTIWALREADLLHRIREIYAVSGGSILATLIVQNWKLFTGTEAEFDIAVKKVLSIGDRDLRGRVIRRWFMTWPTTFFPRRFDALKIGPIELLVKQYRSVFGGISFFDLYKGNEGAPYLYILATSFVSGELCTLSKDGCFVDGNGGIQIPYDSIDIASAVAASSAFPALFPPLQLKREQLDADVSQMPVSPYLLVDGGVYDNLGFEKAILMHEYGSSDSTAIVVSDAGSPFDWDVDSGFYWPISRAVRAVDILMNRIALNTLGKFGDAVNGITVILCSISSKTNGGLRISIQNILPHIRTDLDHFSSIEMKTLMLHGRNVAADQFIRRYKANIRLLDYDWDATGTTPENTIKSLRKSMLRKWRVFSIRDWISWLQLVMLAFVVFVSFAPIAHLVNALARANAATDTASQAAIDAENNLRKLEQELAARDDLVNALQAQIKKPQLRTCRVASNGVESYGKSQIVTLTSPQMGGGHSQPEWCNQAIQSLRAKYTEFTQFTVISSSESSHSTCPPFNCPSYQYTCVIRIDSDPLFRNAPSAECP